MGLVSLDLDYSHGKTSHSLHLRSTSWVNWSLQRLDFHFCCLRIKKRTGGLLWEDQRGWCRGGGAAVLSDVNLLIRVKPIYSIILFPVLWGRRYGFIFLSWQLLCCLCWTKLCKKYLERNYQNACWYVLNWDQTGRCKTKIQDSAFPSANCCWSGLGDRQISRSDKYYPDVSQQRTQSWSGWPLLKLEWQIGN